jgi:CII-binding regulator of phage lambda lysogenization HflD
MKIDIIKSILAINPKAVVSVSGDDVNQIEWLENTVVIDSATILAKQSELQALEDVYEKRRQEYGSVVSQLDEIYHNGIDSWKARIAQIKADNPKENN